MNLRQQRELAARYLDVGKERIWLDPEHAEDIEKAITRLDILNLVKEGAIKIKVIRGQNRAKARKRAEQKKKGRQKGHGKRKGRKHARLPKKTIWITKIRALRSELSKLKEQKKITKPEYLRLYRLAKGNVLRTRSHLRLYAKNMRLHGEAGITEKASVKKEPIVQENKAKAKEEPISVETKTKESKANRDKAASKQKASAKKNETTSKGEEPKAKKSAKK